MEAGQVKLEKSKRLALVASEKKKSQRQKKKRGDETSQEVMKMPTGHRIEEGD